MYSLQPEYLSSYGAAAEHRCVGVSGDLKPLARPVSVEDMNRAILKRGTGDDRSRHRTSWSDILQDDPGQSRKATQLISSNVRVTIKGLSIASSCVNWCGLWKAPTGIQKTRL